LRALSLVLGYTYESTVFKACQSQKATVSGWLEWPGLISGRPP
jgi:hypothetical protein